MLDLPPDWEEGLARAASAGRIAVVGPTDVGKSSFIRALVARRAEMGFAAELIDLDPGQKMIGPPGTVALGRLEPVSEVDRFIFLGSTAIGGFGRLARAAAELAAAAGKDGFVVNTSGYVHGPGAQMQALCLAAVAPDLLVAIGEGASLDAVIGRLAVPAIRLQPSPAARRKTPAARVAIRQNAFEAALAGGEDRTVAAAFEPAPPRPFDTQARPVCSLADAAGDDCEIGVLTSSDGTVFARDPASRISRIRLGKMWAAPAPGGWRLLERLVPAWS
jgi:polynucleotide 5'-hydroxyl-kinase GRC3/NOL9